MIINILFISPIIYREKAVSHYIKYKRNISWSHIIIIISKCKVRTNWQNVRTAQYRSRTLKWISTLATVSAMWRNAQNAPNYLTSTWKRNIYNSTTINSNVRDARKNYQLFNENLMTKYVFPMFSSANIATWLSQLIYLNNI